MSDGRAGSGVVVIRRAAGPGLVAWSVGAAAAGLVLGTAPDAGRGLGGLTAVAMALASAVSAAVVARTGGRLPGTRLAGAGAVCAGIGLWLAASVSGRGAWTWSLALASVGFCVAFSLQRLLVAENSEIERRMAGHRPYDGASADPAEVEQSLYARFNWYWTAVIVGCLCPLAWAMLWSADPGAVLQVAGVAATAGGLLTLLPPAAPAYDPFASDRSNPGSGASSASVSSSPGSSTSSPSDRSAPTASVSGSAVAAGGGVEEISVPDAPWARRSIAAGFGVGALFAGMAGSGHALLSGEWQRTPRGAAGVLAAGAAGAAVAVLFGRWFHRLDRRRGAARAEAAGFQMMVGGLLALLGAFSFTYIGLIVAWSMAAGALALAAVGLDAAVWSGLSPSARRSVAARQVVGFAGGAAAIAALLAGPLAGRHHQVKIAVAALACIEVGRRLSRRCPPAAAADRHRRSWSATVPRRVRPGGGSPGGPTDAALAEERARPGGGSPGGPTDAGLAEGRARPGGGEPADAALVEGRVRPGGGGPLLELDGVGVAYEGVQVVFDASLTVEEGQVAVLLGTNGAGKTTTLRAVSGLEPVSAGRIVFRGLDVTRTPPTWRVGMGLHQIVGGEAVATGLTVEENLRLFSHSAPRARADAGMADALDLFPRLGERLSRRAATLSGGEKQMLALAKALIVEPRLLLIDELSLGLAPALVTELVPVVRQIAARGASVLLVEQSLNVACDLADRAYVMEKGEIRHRGPVTDPETMADLLRSLYLTDARPPASP